MRVVYVKSYSGVLWFRYTRVGQFVEHTDYQQLAEKPTSPFVFFVIFVMLLIQWSASKE